MAARALLWAGHIAVWSAITASLLTAGAFGYARLHSMIILSVQTGSMRPVIRRGDAVLVRPGSSNLEPGDVITYRKADNPAITITHRVVLIDTATGRLITKGDALDAVDPPLVSGQVVGRVVHRLPLAGWILDFIRRPAGLLSVVYVPAAILTAGELHRLARYFDSRRYQLHSY
jgi:signal peptidase